MDSPFHLHNKTILITGATSGIGTSSVRSIIKQGGKVVISGRNEKKLEQLSNDFPEDIIQSIKCDFSEIKNVKALSKTIGKIDGLLHCIGKVTPYPVKYLNREKINETMGVNYYSAVELVAHLDQNKKFNSGASIVFISSISADHPHKGGTAYSSSKAALEAFSKVTAMEYAHKKIRANVIAPGMVATEMYEKAKLDASIEKMQKHIDQYPLGIGQPEDVANAAVFLLSDASRWMTGSKIVIDGGVLLGY